MNQPNDLRRIAHFGHGPRFWDWQSGRNCILFNGQPFAQVDAKAEVAVQAGPGDPGRAGIGHPDAGTTLENESVRATKHKPPPR